MEERDLIRRVDAISALGEEPEVWFNDDGYEHGLRDQWRYDVDAIKAAPSVQRHTDEEIQKIQDAEQAMISKAFQLGQQDAQQWIPVTERMPENNTEVWVTTEMLSEVTRARWHKDSNLWCHPYNSDCLLALRPVAWMEISLPKPYKGERDG